MIALLFKKLLTYEKPTVAEQFSLISSSKSHPHLFLGSQNGNHLPKTD